MVRAELEEVDSSKDQRRVIERNLTELKEARGGANRRLLKRLTRKVVESIVVQPGGIAVRYWTSNERRDAVFGNRESGASDRTSGAPPLVVRGQNFNEGVDSFGVIKSGE